MMADFAPFAVALAAFTLTAGLLYLAWDPTRVVVAAFGEAMAYHDPLQSLVIAGGGGAQALRSDEAWRTGLTNEVHDQLNLTEAQFAQGLVVAAAVAGTALAAMMFLVLQSWSALLIGVVAGVTFRFVFEMAIKETMRRTYEDQLRQFPFFLDIFQLTVQSGGDLGDAIGAYRSIYGNDPIGRELAILQESYPAFGVAESFDRLRNRVGDVDLKNVIGELAQKIRLGDNLEKTLEQQGEDMRDLREELAAKKAEQLNAQFNFPVVFATLATFLIFLSPAIALIFDSGFM